MLTYKLCPLRRKRQVGQLPSGPTIPEFVGFVCPLYGDMSVAQLMVELSHRRF